jgi:hypothetical protein
VDLIEHSHVHERARSGLRRTAARAFRTLRGAGLIVTSGARPARVEVSPGLQRDFSLNYTLSLYLLDTLPRLDRAAPTYAYDVLSLTESILEDPNVVLFSQLDKLKGEKIAEWKAQGMEYAERMQELEKLEYPKPLRDFIYDSFNAFAERHPWVGQENIRPKSVARDILERWMSFNDYVREYGLERSEGVLLRYLSEAYKAVVQTVPKSYRSDEIDDAVWQLGETIRAVDSSLLDEWERMRSATPLEKIAPKGEDEPGPKRGLQSLAELGDNPRALGVRVRSSLHRIVVALSRRDFAGAAAVLWDPERTWTPEALAAAMEPYFAAHAELVATPAARRPDKTVLKQVGPGQWEARQILVDPAGDEDWMLDAFVDLDAPRPDGTDLETTPLVQLRRVGI